MTAAPPQKIPGNAPAPASGSDLNAPPQADEVFLVDGSGYIFRAYFALPQTLTNPEGVPVGAVLGFTNMLLKLLNDIHAPYIAVIFDAARRNFRNEIYPDYKANREAAPEDLVPQFPLIREATEAFGIPAIEMEGYEADDLIATYARLATEQGRRVTIVGTDKDLMQLVNDNVRLYDPIKARYLGRDDVAEKFGAPPEKVVDIQALAGDSVDNVPGVPGIGIKTAAQLIEAFGTLEELLDRAHEIPQPKRRETLIAHADNARISKKLATLDAHVDIALPLERLKAHEPDSGKLTEFLLAQGFNTLLGRLKGGNAGMAASLESGTTGAGTATVARSRTVYVPAPNRPQIGELPPLPAIDRASYTLITDIGVLRAWIARAYDTGVLAIDTETTNLTPRKASLVGISISPAVGEAAYIPLRHVRPGQAGGNAGDNSAAGTQIDLLSALTAAPASAENNGEDSNDGDSGPLTQIPAEEALALLKPLLEDEAILKVGHNIKYDWQIFHGEGIDLFPVDDTILLSYVLDGSGRGHGLDALAMHYFAHQTIAYTDVTGKGKTQIGFSEVALDKACAYAAEDADVTLRLHRVLKQRLVSERMTSVYEDIERPMAIVVGRMEYEGVRVDPLVLKRMSADFEESLGRLEGEIHADAGHPFNVGSPRQVGTVLFEEMGIKGGKKTKTGDWSTSADILETLSASGYAIVTKILQWRQLAKLKSTYTDALQNEICAATGRVHTSFHLAGTSTGRFASSDPNLQNIPIRTEEGRKIRTAFVADKGRKILSADYSQVELRLAAEVAGAEALKQAFREKVDIHALTAAQVFGLKLADVTPDMRRQAKAVNFGIIYGISGWGLAQQLGCSPGEAAEFIRRYLSRFPEIQDYMEARKEEARQYGYVKTLFGRKCYIPDINNKLAGIRMGAERQAINAPLQGTAADIMKIAMARMGDALAAHKLSAKMLLQVHDELVFEVPEDEADETARVAAAVMEGAARLSVPLIVETGIGDSWASAH